MPQAHVIDTLDQRRGLRINLPVAAVGLADRRIAEERLAALLGPAWARPRSPRVERSRILSRSYSAMLPWIWSSVGLQGCVMRRHRDDVQGHAMGCAFIGQEELVRQFAAEAVQIIDHQGLDAPGTHEVSRLRKPGRSRTDPNISSWKTWPSEAT